MQMGENEGRTIRYSNPILMIEIERHRNDKTNSSIAVLDQKVKSAVIMMAEARRCYSSRWTINVIRLIYP